MAQGNDHWERGATGEPQSPGGTVTLGRPGAATGSAPLAETHTASSAAELTATVQLPVGLRAARPPPPPDAQAQGASAVFDRARGPDEVLSYMRPLGLSVRHHRADLTPSQLDDAIDLSVAIMESGKERPFEREAGEIFPLYNWADVHEHMVDLIADGMSKADALSRYLAERHGDQVLDLVEYLFEYTHDKLGTNPRNGPPALGNGGIDHYEVSSQLCRAVLFRGPVGIVRELRRDPDTQDSETLSRAWDLCRRFFERETDPPATREFGDHVRQLCDWDPEWMRSMAGHVFPTGAADKIRFRAALSTFLAKDPTEEMFFDPVFHDVYRRAMALTEKDVYAGADPAFSTGRIFAHAHIRFERFGPDHPLFREFREGCTRRQIMGFVEHTSGFFTMGFPVRRGFTGPRAIATWEWLLAHPDPEILRMLGDWMCIRSGVFSPDGLADLILRTMRLTNGRLNSDGELYWSIEELAAKVPDKAIEILELYFRPENLGDDHHRRVLYLGEPERWGNVIGALSQNPRTQARAHRLTEFLEEVRREYWRERDRRAGELAERIKTQ